MSTVTMVALCNNKKNKTRSRLIMAAIFLSTVLLTVICTLGYGLVKVQKANAALDYGSYYGVFQSVNTDELREIERHGEFSKLGIMAVAGMIESETDSSLVMGDKVCLSYRADLKHKYELLEFTVSGILDTPKRDIRQNSFMGYVSMAFYEAQYPAESRKYSVAFRLADDVPVTYDDAEEVIKEIAANCGIAAKRVSVNTLYLMWTLDPGTETMAVCAVIAAAVVLFSVIVIYNIFQVSIVQNIREYGKIRALGATKKQMRKLIYCEGMFLAAFSIPAGVTVGYVAAWAGFEWLMAEQRKVSGMEMVSVSIFSPFFLLLAAALAFLTMLLALRKPMKIAGSVSPVDALRYMESTGSKKAGIRKGRKRLSVWSLSAAAIAADKKRTLMTIFTMGLSCVMFVVLANCVGNMDSEYDARNNVENGQFQIELDYSIADEAYSENNLDMILKNDPLNKELTERIKEIDGVTQVKTRDILLMEVNGRQESAAVFDKENFEREKQHGGSMGRLEYGDSKERDLVYYCWSHFMEDNGYGLGQKLSIKLQNGTDTRNINSVLEGSFGSFDTGWAITQEMYERLELKGASIGWIWADCKPEDVQAVRTELEHILDGVEHVEMTAFSDVLQQSRASVRVIKMACYLFLAMIGLIGFMNLANTMIMNIITKKQEYGIMQAAGMTNRQLNSSLQIQGLLFSAGTALVAVAVGLPAGYGVFCYGKANAVFGLNVYHVPVLEIAGMIAAIGLLQAVLSYVLSRNLKKESLVERIRYQQ